MYYVWGNPSTRMSMPRSSLGRSMIIRPEASSSSRERRKERVIKSGKRIRQNFVYKPEEEILHEPYMLSLYREFSETPGYCDSTVEIPWNDIALPLAEIRLRQEEIERKKAAKVNNDDRNKDNVIKDDTSEKRKSTGMMELPWNDLLVTELVDTKQEESSSPLQREIEICDSTVEIPWGELGLDQPVEILPLPEIEVCANDDIEIPWDDIMLPKNILIKSIRTKHPSASGRGRKRHRPEQLDSNCQCIPGTGPKR